MENPQELTFNCAYNVQHINQTDDKVKYTLPAMIYNKILCNGNWCNAGLDPYRICVASVPLAITGVTTAEALYRKASFGIKKFINIAAYSALYTAACLYVYDNYINRSDAADNITGWIIIAGNAFIAEYLKR